MAPLTRAVASVAIAALVAGCQNPAPQQMLKGDVSTLQQKVDYLNNRINQLEQSASKQEKEVEEAEKAQRQAKADQSVLNQELQADLRTLKGTIEVLRHDFDSNHEGDQKIRADFDARLSDLEQKVSTISTAPAPIVRPGVQAGGTKRSSGSDITRYNQILRLILDKKDYDTAITQFREFIREYPDSSLADNAQYWVGEGFYAQGNYTQAITEFQTMLDDYPNSEKRCDALLKQGYAFADRKEPEKANLFLVETTKKCPHTKYATRAADKMKELAGSSTKR